MVPSTGTCQLVPTEIQPTNFIRCLEIKVCTCANTRIWNFKVFFVKCLSWSRFLKDWNLEFGKILWKIPLSVSQTATRRSSGFSFLIKLQLLSVMILLEKLHVQFMEVVWKPFVMEYIFSNFNFNIFSNAVTLKEWAPQ